MRKNLSALAAIATLAFAPGATAAPSALVPVVDTAPASSAPDTAPSQQQAPSQGQQATLGTPTGKGKKFCQTSTAVNRAPCPAALACPGARFPRSQAEWGFVGKLPRRTKQPRGYVGKAPSRKAGR